VLAKTFEENRAYFRDQGLRPASAALKESNIAAAQKVFTDVLEPSYQKVSDSLRPLIELQKNVARAEYETAVKRSELISWVAVVSLVVGLPIAALFSFLLISGLSRSMARAVELANAVAKGDLTQKIVVEGKDEVALLMSALSDMSQSLVAVVASVRQGSEGVATASAEIAQGNNDLSARTEQQASALEETAASMEELGSTVTECRIGTNCQPVGA
jgi:methyl-accepting chemotaxis protein-1 (serine sensor receptor)